jgi:signal transduction histidine kinase
MQHRGRSGQPVKGRRANRPKARKASTTAPSTADLQKQVVTLTRELKESNERQTAMLEVLEVINDSPGDLAPVFDVMLDKATRLCEADSGFLWLMEGSQFRAVATRGVPAAVEEILRQSSTPHPEQGIGRILRGEENVRITDVTAGAAYRDNDPVHRACGDLGEMRSIAVVPMRVHDDLVGGFTIFRREVRPFEDQHISLLQNFAAQAVIAIENARLFGEVQAKTRDLTEALQQQTATADVLKIISRSAFDLQAVFDTLTTSAVDLLGAHSGTICVREGDVFRYRSVAGASWTEALWRFLVDHPVTPGRTTASGRAILSGQIEQIADILEDPDYAIPMQILTPDHTPRAMLSVPLLGKDRIEGAMVLSRQQPGLYTQREVDILQTFADQAVIAIENARLFEEVQAKTRDLEQSLDDLRAAQDRLVQTEKLASLGQLTAGIAHEIKNPLNFVNNFAALSVELTDEINGLLKQAALVGRMREDVSELTSLLKDNLSKIVQHGKRADSIVKNMLLHSREGSGERRSADINSLVAESLNLAYHGARAEKPGFTITLKHNLDPEAGAANLYPQEITRALLNLISNGFYAATRRKIEAGDGTFEPILSAATRNLGKTVEIRIRDNGTGIPPEVREKMFNPFFTTKPTGQGTGLGLSMTHDIIVKQHGGRIDVDTEPGAFTEFIVTLPRDNDAHSQK